MKTMNTVRTLPQASVWALLATLALSGCINSHDTDSTSGSSPSADNFANGISTGSHAVNGSIHVSAGTPGGEVSTINGSIHADENAQFSGGHTVNGNIGLGPNASATSLTTVNGGIDLGPGAHVSETVSTVNGTLRLGPGAVVGGRLANVNGTIILGSIRGGATVNGGITTVNGNIDIEANSHVQGGIIVHKPSTGFFHWWSDSDKPRVVVGPGAVVEGTMQFDRAVRLYVSDTATIGAVTGATPIRFSGTEPPG
jgi:hypothetical protein